MVTPTPNPFPITCHVLNTLTGLPASGILTSLTLQSGNITRDNSVVSFQASTDADGRIKDWGSTPSRTESMTVADAMGRFNAGDRVQWTIRFFVGAWYAAQGVEAFWPEINVSFFAKRGDDHTHVPLLLGPFSYTTYRGS